MNKVALITMGHSSAGNDVEGYFTGVELHTRGILDGYDYPRILDELWPRDGEDYIVSEMPDGQGIRLAEHKTIALTANVLLRCKEEGFNAAQILCTGHFELPETPGMLVVLPERVLPGLLHGLGVRRLGSIVPEADQIPETLDNYRAFSPDVISCSPFSPAETVGRAASYFKNRPVDIVMLDCMGFCEAAQAAAAQASGKPVLLARAAISQLTNSIMSI